MKDKIGYQTERCSYRSMERHTDSIYTGRDLAASAMLNRSIQVPIKRPPQSQNQNPFPPFERRAGLPSRTIYVLTSPGSSMTLSLHPLCGITPVTSLPAIAIPSPSPRSTYFRSCSSSQIRWKYMRRLRRPRR